jgi:hypothetical protein
MVEVNAAAILPDLIGKAKVLLLLKSQFNKAWIGFWFNHIQPCDEATFYRLLPVYRGFVDQFVFGYKRIDVGVQNASWELFRQVSTGEGSWTWDEAAGFVKFYEQLDNQIGRALAHLFDYHGDSYSDLCDSLPLAGEDVVRRCLASHPKSHRPRREGFLEEAELREAVKALGPQWSKLILEGENYVVSALRAACKKDWLYEVMVDREGKHGWSEQDKMELSYANHDDE